MRHIEAPTTPRGSPTTRAFVDEPEGHDSKCARTASSKKQRIERVAEQYEAAIRMVKVSAQEEFHTMDDYNTHLQLDDQDEVDIWAGEENVSTSHMPAKLWSNHDVSQQPPERDPEVDQLADDVEMKRPLEMGVPVRACDYGKKVTEKLTTKCVYDWRLRDNVESDGSVTKCWFGRSRLVAREYAFLQKRADTYSPASSTHILNLLPLILEAMTQRAKQRQDLLLWGAWMSKMRF